MALEFGNQSKSYLSKLLRANLNSFKSCGYEKITVDGTVKGLTIPTDAKYAVCSLVSTTLTGVVANCLQNRSVTVSATVGMPLRDGNVFDITDTQNLAGFQITQTGAFTTSLYVEYYK